MAKTQSRTAGTHLTLNLGPRVTLTVTNKQGTSRLDLDHLIADFQEAVDEPHTPYRIKDFCGEDFFKRKTGQSSKLLYQQTQLGNADGAAAFVVYGAHIGALLANLETLFRPTDLTLTGPITDWFDAWSHAMGKARKKHLGTRPAHCVTVQHLVKGQPVKLNDVKFCKTKTAPKNSGRSKKK